ncbi:MAG: hypothetical protein LBF34_02135, partial [Puniceicoccales bacterium]|nr:hypothetical protein [Puniceicoccales bacterium]
PFDFFLLVAQPPAQIAPEVAHKKMYLLKNWPDLRLSPRALPVEIAENPVPGGDASWRGF